MSDTITTNGVRPRYTVIIQWSDEDQVYVVSLPEWGPYAKTHGSTYAEAAANAQEVLELLMEPEPGRSEEPQHPAPRLFHYPGADVVDLPHDAVDAAAQIKSPATSKKSA